MDDTITHSVETLAYTAGIIDGEGCISIVKVQPTKANHRITPGYELYVSVSSTDKFLAQYLKEIFGGNITDRTNHPSMHKIGWKPAVSWRIASNEARNFLSLILPYLRSKHIQANLAIEFQDYKRANRLYYRPYQLQQEILEREEMYYQHLNSLHNTKKQWIRSEAIDNAVQARSTLNTAPCLLTPAIIAYIAGIVDGEGCIRISMRQPDGKTGKGHLRQPSYCLRVKVANTDKSLIDWLQVIFTGSIQECSSEQRRAKTGHSQAWEWKLDSNKGMEFLRMIEPFLRTKRNQAILAIEYQAYSNQYSRYVQGNRSQNVLDCLEAYRQKINGMNAKPAKLAQG